MGGYVKSGPFLNAGCIMYSISIFFILHFTQWRHLGGGGAGGSADPPRIVKGKSFALSVSSKGSL